MKKALCLFLLILLPLPAYSFVSDTDAEKVILGAASDESDRIMYAVACALRNRDTTTGIQEVYAYIDGLPDDVRARARKAWSESENCRDVTDGANAWFNDPDDGNYIRERYIPRWAKKSRFKCKMGRHHFYKLPIQKQDNVLVSQFRQEMNAELETIHSESMDLDAIYPGHA